MTDLLNYNLLDDYFKQFSPLKNDENIFEKLDEKPNYVLSGFSDSNGLVKILSKAYEPLNS